MEAQFQSSNTGPHQRLATPLGIRFHDYVQSHTRTVAIAAAITAAAVFAIPLAVQALSQDKPGNTDTMHQNSQSSQADTTAGAAVPQTAKQPQQPAKPQTGSQGSAANQSQTNVTVNGQKVTVPENGTYNKTIENGTSRTDINVQSNHSSTTNGASAGNNSSVNVNINAESHSSSSD